MVLSNYNSGWREELERYIGMKLEYVPLDIAWKCARYGGLREHYPNFFAKSGFFAFFLYDIDKFWVHDLFRLFLVDNALNASNVQRITFDPKNADEGIAFLEDMVNRGNLVWVSWMEPLLVFGVEDSDRGVLVHWYNPVFAPEGTTWGRDELERWWNWADFDGAHLMIAPTGISPGTNSEEFIIVELVKLAVQNKKIEYYEFGDTKIPFGINAYSAYASDLRNPDVDFLQKSDDGKLERTSWFDFAIYSQWTQTFAAHSYFSRISSIFPEDEREALKRASEHYGRCYAHWIEWEKIIGRHPDRETFYARIKDMKKRSSAADVVIKARDELEKALGALEEFLAKKNISTDEKVS
ncbi:hypothetical protein DRQ26_01185 [bacterium]|nr:MAG: hypothetical protein DRQ26_01185 [bacterium]